MAGSRFYRSAVSRTLDVAEVARGGLLHTGAAARSEVRRSGRRFVPLLLVLVLVGAPWLVLSDGFYVYEAETMGAQRLTSEEVLAASGLVGRHVLTVRPDAIEASLLGALPTLKSARVSCRITGRCRIAVEERQPIAVWEEDGAAYWVDEEGLTFPFDGTWSALLHVSGPMPRGEDGRLDGEIRSALTELASAGLQGDTVVRYTLQHGLVLADSQGRMVVLGTGGGMAGKLEIVERLMAQLAERGLEPRFVDVRFPSAPYFSLTNGM
jgi:cell division septal protein FtsQ